MRISAIALLLSVSSWLVFMGEASGIRRGAEFPEVSEKKSSPITIDNKALPDGEQRRRAYALYVVAPDLTTIPNNDLDMRFSKIRFEDDSVDTSRLPLTAADYPVTMETALWLSRSDCPSVTVPEVCSECEGIDFPALVQDIGGPPSHPGQAGFWDELFEVAEVQKQRLNGTDVNKVLPLPDIWQDFDTLEDVANAVHDEYPGLHHQALIGYLMRNGATVDNNTVPQHCNAEFLRGIVMLSHLNTWAIAEVGPVNFAVKYHQGRARPEEVAYKISTPELNATDGVPQKLLDIIPQNSLSTAEEFTAYPEGSPMHPSWPAMHSAASVGSTWLAVVLNLSDEQHCQAKLVDYGVAYARTVAGVHYASDNIAGLRLGQQIMEDKLPSYLEEKYGADPALVQAKIAAVHFDWDDFTQSECYISRMT